MRPEYDLTDDEIDIGWAESRRESNERRVWRSVQIQRQNETWRRWLTRAGVIGGSLLLLLLATWLAPS